MERPKIITSSARGGRRHHRRESAVRALLDDDEDDGIYRRQQQEEEPGSDRQNDEVVAATTTTLADEEQEDGLVRIATTSNSKVIKHRRHHYRLVAGDNEDDEEQPSPQVEGGNNIDDNNDDDDASFHYHSQDEDEGFVEPPPPTPSTTTGEEDENELVTTGILSPRWKTMLHTTLLPDNRFYLSVGGGKDIPFLDGAPGVRLVKFICVTFIGIFFTYYFVRAMGWEHDDKEHLQTLWMYDGVNISCDTIAFFVVGRLYRMTGVDHIMWLGFAALASLYASYGTTLPIMQHSFTLYEMHCVWPWQLWAVITGLIIPVAVTVLILHVHRSWKQGIVLLKFTELTLCLLFLMVPYLTSPYFHLHHWYAGFLFGMHANFDVWWSRATMAWCWGLYINGIAVYGRDPVLTCGYGLYMATSQRCPYLQCYIDGLKNETNTTQQVEPMIPPDWRNCSASSYHP